MRRGHQHGLKDYPVLHSWARKENRKQREGKSSSDQLSKGETLRIHHPQSHRSPSHILQCLWYPSMKLPSASVRRLQSWQWLDLRLLIIKGSSREAARAPFFHASPAIILSTPHKVFLPVPVNPRLAPLPNCWC